MNKHIVLKRQGSRTTLDSKNLSYNNAQDIASRKNLRAEGNTRYFVAEQRY